MDMEDIYENIENKKRNTDGPQNPSQNQTAAQSSRRWFVVITVCLGLFCVLLVIALILLYINLTAERDQMKMTNMNIAEDLNETLNSLKVNYSHLTNEKDQLQKDLKTINQKKLELETNNTLLTYERDQLQINLTSISQKKLELETRVKNLNDALNNFPGPGLVWYYISTESKSWSDSRQYCRDRGGDLVIINTEEEQKYISSLVKERVWIGLSDIENEGKMKWVDNTTLNKGFWYKGEPNDANGNEDCVEIIPTKPVLNNWNDLSCSETRKWICET